VFAEFDEDKSGEISDIELKEALGSMGVQVPLSYVPH